MTFAGDDEFEGPPEDLKEQLVVKSTFLDLTDGLSAMQRFMRLRRAKSDPTLGLAFKLDHQELTDECGEHAATLGVASEAEDSDIPEPQGRTTVCLRNVPNNYTRQMLLELLEEQGLSGHFDFLYLPCDFHRHANLGYAFINLVDEASVTMFWSALDGFTGWSLPTFYWLVLAHCQGGKGEFQWTASGFVGSYREISKQPSDAQECTGRVQAHDFR
eukprot:CAMPEP_0114653658 /NCGR_PEP_ID=MMETSP0191-20121206/9923_1 /TAXON_ID=126664 /ORGANISM="Sorites sp." /LENGTH=215 /DNA_ID=CAMNT_0001868811 /DNA_START=50 /DNA_END=697 /DNA_ORIENTATION=+